MATTIPTGKDRDRKIIEWYTQDGYTLEEIGILLGGLSRQRVHQIIEHLNATGTHHEARRRRREDEHECLVQEWWEQVIAAYREQPSLREISVRLDLPYRIVEEIVEQKFSLVERRIMHGRSRAATLDGWTYDRVGKAFADVALALGEFPSAKRYGAFRAAHPELKLPSVSTIHNIMGGWGQALAYARDHVGGEQR